MVLFRRTRRANSPSLQRLIVVAVMAASLSACGRSESFRYKLTLVVNTPDGPRRGSSVVESAFWNFWFPEKDSVTNYVAKHCMLTLALADDR